MDIPTKHPSFGHATPEEIELLKNADGGRDHFTKQKLIEQIKERGKGGGEA